MLDDQKLSFQLKKKKSSKLEWRLLNICFLLGFSSKLKALFYENSFDTWNNPCALVGLQRWRFQPLWTFMIAKVQSSSLEQTSSSRSSSFSVSSWHPRCQAETRGSARVLLIHSRNQLHFSSLCDWYLLSTKNFGASPHLKTRNNENLGGFYKIM